MGLGKIIGAGFNVKKWIGLDSIKKEGSVVTDIVKEFVNLGKRDPNAVNESFAACMARYNMTEADLKRRMSMSVRLAILFGLFGCGLFIYMIYLLIIGQLLSGLVCLSITLFVCAKAYREHFNYFQMRQRRLGCTFREWLHFTFGIKSNKSKKKMMTKR